MPYTEKSAVGEIISFIFIRIACVAVCVMFFLPMFGINVFSERYSREAEKLENISHLTGFDSMFGVKGTPISGNPLSLVVFIFPIVLIMLSFIDLFYEHYYKISFVGGILGILISVFYFASETSYLTLKSSAFQSYEYEIKSSLGLGCFLIIAIYAVIIGLSFLLGKFGKSNT